MMFDYDSILQSLIVHFRVKYPTAQHATILFLAEMKARSILKID